MKKYGLFFLIGILSLGLCGCKTEGQKQNVTPTETVKDIETTENPVSQTDNRKYTVWNKDKDETVTYTTEQLREQGVFTIPSENGIKAFLEEKWGKEINNVSYTLLEYRDFPKSLVLDISLDKTTLVELLSEIIEGKPFRYKESGKADYENNLPICKIVTDKYDYEITYQPDMEYKIIRIVNMQTDCSWYFSENTIEDRKTYWENVAKGCECGCIDEENTECGCEEDVGC